MIQRAKSEAQQLGRTAHYPAAPHVVVHLNLGTCGNHSNTINILIIIVRIRQYELTRRMHYFVILKYNILGMNIIQQPLQFN